jgi:hypothetical protein
MQTLLLTLVFIVQLAGGAFVIWGVWLCFNPRAREPRSDRADVAEAAPAKADSFERVASLVLLALLCTTIAALG